MARSQLQTFDYTTALAFLQQYGNADKARLLGSLARTSFTNHQIVAELETLAATPPPSPTPPTQSTPPAQAPAGLEELKQRRNDLVRQMDNLHGSLEYLSTREERYQTALSIITMEQEWRHIWAQIDHLEQFGAPMPVIPTDELEKIFYQRTTVSDLTKVRNNYRTHVSRAKKGKSSKPAAWYQTVVTEAERRIREAEANAS